MIIFSGFSDQHL